MTLLQPVPSKYGKPLPFPAREPLIARDLTPPLPAAGDRHFVVPHVLRDVVELIFPSGHHSRIGGVLNDKTRFYRNGQHTILIMNYHYRQIRWPVAVDRQNARASCRPPVCILINVLFLNAQMIRSKPLRQSSPLLWGIARRLVFLLWLLVPLWLAVWLALGANRL